MRYKDFFNLKDSLDSFGKFSYGIFGPNSVNYVLINNVFVFFLILFLWYLIEIFI